MFNISPCHIKTLFIMKKFLPALLCLGLYAHSFAQCDVNVPTYYIDLSNNPDTTWTLLEADADNRDGFCCGASGSDNCIRFEITLSPEAAGIYFNYDGAPSYGSLAWQLDCGPEYNLRDTICVSDPGPFTLSFCKPGTDNGNYTLVSVAKPTFPGDQEVPLNCVQPVQILGVTADSPTWESISPGVPGQYNSMLSCTDCLEPIFTPDPNAPTEIEYRVCGYPLLDYCVGDSLFCDTVKFTTLDSLMLNVSPMNPTFCAGGSVNITASATGGDGNYNYIWYDGNLNMVGTGSVLNVSVAGTYSVELRDGNYEPGYCDDFIQSVQVNVASPPTIDAGSDMVLCAESPNYNLNATVSNASGVIWSGGNGLFSPSNTDANATYIPTTAEIDNGSVILTVTSTGSAGGCANVNDDIELFYTDTLQSTLADFSIDCFNSESVVNANITGGIAPYTYTWSDGTDQDNATLGNGTHCLSVEDANGCAYSTCFNISAPSELSTSNSSTPVSVDGGSDGTATVSASGGTAPYTYLWSNGGTTATITGLPYGIYTVVVTDDNGCQRESSVVVNEPRCNNFFASTTSSDVLCNGDGSGEATAIPNNGTSPYTYNWSDDLSQTTATATGLVQGVYEVTIVDDNGCIATNTASIFEPTAVMNSMTSSDATTQGGSDGSATANVTGGTAPYNYLWSTGGTTDVINGLVAGWYSVVITDDNGCSLSDSIYVNEPPCNDMYTYVNTTSPLCAGDSTAIAELIVVNGVGPYSINWSTGDVDVMSLSNQPADLYSVEVVDSRGCYAYKSYGISEPSVLTIAMNATPSSCLGSNNGTIDVSVLGGTYPYYYYNWNSGQTSEDIIGLSPGSYTITVTDENGCVASASSTLIDPDALNVNYTTTDVSCYAGTDGAIDVTTSGGILPYSYSWSNGATTEDLSGIDFGGYILSVTDANNCHLSSPITLSIDEPEELTIASYVIDCPAPGASDAMLHITPQGGTPDYSISFDGGNTFEPAGTFEMLLATGATHDIVLTDLNNCLSVSQPISINSTIQVDNIVFDPCYANGQTIADVVVTASGGNGNYAISSDNGISYGSNGISTINVGIDNTYNIIAQDDLGCNSVPMPITLPSFLSNTSSITSDYNGQQISCFGSSDGTIEAQGIGGTAPYTYSWSNGTNTAINDNLSAGAYSVVIEDANGCQTMASETLIQPTEVDMNSYSIDCPVPGSGESLVHVLPEGGTPNYSVSFDGGATFETTGTFDMLLNAGASHDIIIQDLNGCLSSVSAISVNAEPYVSSVIFDPCYAKAQLDVDLTLNAAGGSGSYSFSVDNGSSYNGFGNNLINVPIDATYSVVVQDNLGCTSLPHSVTLPAFLDNSITIESDYNGENVSCNGASDGSLLAQGIGGVGPYSYLWDNGVNTANNDNLTAGTYSVTITDANGCTTTNSELLSEPTAVFVDNINIDCPVAGGTDALVTVAPNGGIGSYSVSFDNGSTYQALNDFDNMMPTGGSYGIVVMDGNGCTSATSMAVVNPTVAIDDINFNPCYTPGQTTEDIVVTALGGTNSYSMSYDGGTTWTTLNDLSENVLINSSYSVVVQDANGCLSLPFSVTLPDVFDNTLNVTSNFNGSDISCYGLSDGSADATTFGGTAPYSYNWSNGSTTNAISNVTAGNYTVVIDDANGCQISQSITLVNPPQLTSTIGVDTDYNGYDISCFGFSDASSTVVPSGGTGAYTYLWNNNQQSATASGLSAGLYSVSIQDANGCEIGNTITINEPDQLVITTQIANVSCNGGADGEIDATITGGTFPYFYQWSYGPTTQDASGLIAGTYNLTVTDNNNCTLLSDDIVIEPTLLVFDNIITEPSCYGYSDGSIDVTASGGTSPYTYLWDNGDTTQNITGINAGNHSVTITDANGCSDVLISTVDEPTQLGASADVVNASCFEFENGQITMLPSGATPPYYFDWSNGATEALNDGLGAGQYDVVITDSNGCELSLGYVITEPELLTVDLSSPLNFHDHNINFFGGNDGQISSVVNGGTIDYSYYWSNGSSDENIQNLEAGEYILTVIDAQGCEASDTIRLTEPLELQMPTAFSPNNDGDNDVFDIHGIEAYPDNKLTITNRWGNIVFQTEGYHNTWDGHSNNGKELPDGVYFVILEINGKQITKNNYVQIKRF